MEQMDTETSADDGAAEERVVDVAGVEVDALTIDWMVFIALHMDAARSFTDDELLIDLLLMLGYREGEKLRALAQDVLYRTAFRDATVRLGLDGAGLIQRVIVDDDQDLHYELIEKHVQNIREVAEAMGGTVWGDAGTDEIDTYSEVAWLATMALRLKDESTIFRLPAGLRLSAGNRHVLTRDELLDVLDSMWRHGDRETTLEELAHALVLLEDAEYVEQKKKSVLGEEGWTLTRKAWGGVYELRDNLQVDIKGQVSSIEEMPQDPQVASPEDDLSATDDLAQADTEPQDAQHDNAGEQSDVSAEIESVGPENDVSQSTGPVLVAPSAPSEQNEVAVSNADLCFTVLQLLATDQASSLTEDEFVKRVAAKVGVHSGYLKEPLPPWAISSKWSNALRDAGRDPKLFDYRMEHAFRALSIEQVGLIRDVALADSGRENQAVQNRWSLTDNGKDAMLSLLDESSPVEHGKSSVIPDAVHDYFRMHNYEGWRAQDWMANVIKWFSAPNIKTAGEGGAVFELLIKALVEAHPSFSEARLQAHNNYLDEAGVDIVAYLRGDATNGEGDGFKDFNSRRGALLVQCKRYLWNDIPPDAASKLFATMAWLRGQADLGHFRDDVSGALLVFFGDLSREATWTFWALKATWDLMERASRTQGLPSEGTGAGAQPSRPLAWEIWDSRTVLQLMKEYKIGVKVDSSGDREKVAVDTDYLDGLKAEAKEAAEKEKARKAAEKASREKAQSAKADVASKPGRGLPRDKQV